MEKAGPSGCCFFNIGFLRLSFAEFKADMAVKPRVNHHSKVYVAAASCDKRLRFPAAE